MYCKSSFKLIASSWNNSMNFEELYVFEFGEVILYYILYTEFIIKLNN